jgi:ABC-type sugar transport system permease subunit
VGLSNFTRLPGLVGATAAVQNTLVFALLSVPLILVGALAIAMLLARVGRGASTYRFLVYFPVLVPGVVAALIWLFLTNVDFGLFNGVLRLFGAEPVTWLGSGTALLVLALLDVWRNVGYWAIFFVAAIIGLPQELYQAAELDGASPPSRFRYLTLPLLRRILLFAVVVATIWGLQVFDTALVLTSGGPGTATTTIVYRVWQYVFGASDKVGAAAAISLLLIAAILCLTVLQLRLLRSRRGGD